MSDQHGQKLPKFGQCDRLHSGMVERDEVSRPNTLEAFVSVEMSRLVGRETNYCSGLHRVDCHAE